MKFSAAFALTALASLALADTASYDTTYDNPNGSLTTVACSDGSNGLLAKYKIFKDIPSFPYIGGVPAIAGWNSASCGTCWKLVYTPSSGPANTIYILGIDAALTYNTGLTALNNLTDGQGIDLGLVPVTATNVAGSFCGL